MKINQPIGNELYAPFFLRVTLGAYFLIAGWLQLQNIPATVAEVQSFQLLPEHFATVFGILLPYLELFTGILLVLGLWTTLGGLLAALLLTCFVYALGVFPGASLVFNKDLILLAAALSVMFSGAGAFSVDRFRKNGI